jgi:hypothetical protein
VTGETVGNSGVTPTPPFPYWDVAGPTTETEAVGGHFFDIAEPEAADSSRRNPRTVFEFLTLPFLDVAEPTRGNEAVGGHFFDNGGGEFNSNPQTLTPLNLDSALVTDAYQQQDAPGADLIAGEANQGMDPSQAQREQYEVLA